MGPFHRRHRKIARVGPEPGQSQRPSTGGEEPITIECAGLQLTEAIWHRGSGAFIDTRNVNNCSHDDDSSGNSSHK